MIDMAGIAAGVAVYFGTLCLGGFIGMSLYNHFAPEHFTNIGYWTWVLIAFGARSLTRSVKVKAN